MENYPDFPPCLAMVKEVLTGSVESLKLGTVIGVIATVDMPMHRFEGLER